jgi:hypothetical protein
MCVPMRLIATTLYRLGQCTQLRALFLRSELREAEAQRDLGYVGHSQLDLCGVSFVGQQIT